MNISRAAKCFLLLAGLLTSAIGISIAQLGGSGPQRAPATGRNCDQNSKCATVTYLKATIPLDADAVDAGQMVYETTANGENYDTTPGGGEDVNIRRVRVGVPADLGWALMDQAVPIINLEDQTVTWEALFYNRSSNRDRLSSLEVPYSRPRKSGVYFTSSGYIEIPAAGRKCTNDGCATKRILEVVIPKNAEVVDIRYYTTAEDGPNDDDKPLHQLTNLSQCAWCSFQPALPNASLSSSTTTYQSVFLNRSSDRNRYAVVELLYQLPARSPSH